MADYEGQMINAQFAMRNAQSREKQAEMGKLCPPLLCAFAHTAFLVLPALKGKGDRVSGGRVRSIAI